MENGRITVEIDLKKLGIVALMAAAIVIACKTGMGDSLLFIVPGGLAYVTGKGARE